MHSPKPKAWPASADLATPAHGPRFVHKHRQFDYFGNQYLGRIRLVDWESISSTMASGKRQQIYPRSQPHPDRSDFGNRNVPLSPPEFFNPLTRSLTDNFFLATGHSRVIHTTPWSTRTTFFHQATGWITTRQLLSFPTSWPT